MANENKTKEAAIMLARQAYGCALGALAILESGGSCYGGEEDRYDHERDRMQRKLRSVVSDLETFGE
jgi:hypothetical protein